MPCGLWRGPEAIAEEKFKWQGPHDYSMLSYELSHNNPASGSKRDAHMKTLPGLLSSPKTWGNQNISFPRHSTVKSQISWVFKDLEEEFVKDKQIHRSECFPGKKNPKISFYGKSQSLFFCFGMTFYFGILLGIQIRRVCQFKSQLWFSCYSSITLITLCPVS